MSHRLYDITLYYDSKKDGELDFTIRQNLVSDLYITFLDNYKPKRTTRISVELSDEKDYIKGHWDSSILSVIAYFDYKAYWKNSSGIQNQIILDTIHRIAICCADKYGWNKTIFEAAYKKVLECNFIYRQEQTRKFSKDKKHKASLLFEKDGVSTTISVLFYDKDGQSLKTIELFKSHHHFWFYEGTTKNCKWLNNREFGVHAKNHELILKASLDNSSSETLIIPGKYTMEQLEGFLEFITYKRNEDH